MRARRWSAAALLAAAAALLGPGTAAADFGPIQLVSKSAGEQAAAALAPAITADGRYLAFQGTIGGLRGVFRKDLETGAVATVAAGSAYEAKAPGADSGAPSISADGRYVSFTTKAPLDPADDTQPGSSDVYVADMSTPSPPAYELASALDGSQAGLAYEGAGGSVASGRVALSADGREVVFVTTAKSDLTSGPGGSTEGTPTPAGQVVLRDLDTMETTLVSAERDPGTGAMTDLPVPGGAVIEKPAAAAAEGGGAERRRVHRRLARRQSPRPGAACWPARRRRSPRRTAPAPSPTTSRSGAASPTGRVRPRGGSWRGDPSAPFTGLADRNTEFNAAEGWLGVAGIDGVPQLSADGRRSP